MIGTNGLCSVYTPPVSYWCSEHTAGGGAFAFRTPSGLAAKTGALPNSPYKSVKDAQVSDLPCNVRREGGLSLVIGGASLVILEGREGNPL